MLEKLKREVFEANMMLPRYGLVTFTWGNVSGICREEGLVAIKPSGVEYEQLTADDIVIVDMDGRVVEGRLKPSSDTATHLELYRAFGSIGGVVHTHSRYATIFAQSGIGVPPLGTTHADYFYGEIPCTEKMTPDEIGSAYEKNTGVVITRMFEQKNIAPSEIPAALVYSHGPFTWGTDPHNSVHNAVVLEEVAFMAWNNICFSGGKVQPMQKELLDKHFLRKHGANAYYGQ